MRILEKEIALREETRGLEQARVAMELPEYTERAMALSDTQEELAGRVAEVLQRIRDERDGEMRFPKEIALLTRVEEVMREASVLLGRPDTGPEPIAAETEAIELLLQTKRINPGSSGGGGGSSPGGGGGGTTDQSALALIGRGDERQAHNRDRDVRQATGVTGSELPAEFRAGLDAYFRSLEEGAAGLNP